MKLGSLTLAVALFLIVPGVVFGLDSHTPPPGYTPIPSPEKIAGTEVLLIQDVLPWEINPNEYYLDSLGKTYDMVNSNNIPADLSDYKVIMYASDQPTSYYQNIATKIVQIEAFVNSGNLLLAHCCDQAWNMGDWTGHQILPGNVTHVNSYLQDLTVTDTTRCIVRGVNGVYDIWATDPNYFDGWGLSTHGWLTNLPGGATKIICVAGTADPTYISYQYGAGEVWATMQTVEWGCDASLCWAGDRSELLKNELRCANAYEPPVEGIPALTEWGLIIFGIVLLGFISWVFLRRRKVIG